MNFSILKLQIRTHPICIGVIINPYLINKERKVIGEGMDIACDFRIGSIEAADENGCVIATLFLDTTNALGEKELLKVFAKLDLIKRIQEFYAYDPTDYNESYINIFKLSLPVYLREHLTGLILSKL